MDKLPDYFLEEVRTDYMQKVFKMTLYEFSNKRQIGDQAVR